jgi:S1-C subfamily serine protease
MARLASLLALPAVVLALRSGAAAGPPAPERSGFEAALDRVDRHAVVVAIRFRRDLAAEAEGRARAQPDSTPEVFRRWRMSLRVPGFVVRDRRTVLASDVFVPPGAVASVEVEDPRGGPTVRARLSAFLPRCGAVVFEATEDLRSEPVAFATPPAGAPAPTPAFVASVGEGVRGDEAWAEAFTAARRPAFSGGPVSFGAPERAVAGLAGSRLSRTADLVVAADGGPLGFRFGASVDLAQSVWTGPDVLGDLAAAVPFDALESVARDVRESGRVVAVRLRYRAAGDAEQDAASPFAFALDDPVAEPDDDRVHYGLRTSPGVVLVPSALPDAWVRRLESATVEVDAPGGPTGSEGPRSPTTLPARFEGRVRGLGAFVLRIEGAASVPFEAETCPRAPEPEEAFLVHEVAFRGGARRDRTTYDRSLGRARGYGDERLLSSEQPVAAGAFLLALDGRVAGVACDLLPEDVDAEVPALGRPSRAAASRGVVAALFAERGGASVLCGDLDRRVLPADESRRLPWLGVEHEGLDRAVAEALGVSGPTLDGARGRIVTHVHAGSPAARAGLREGDVLLTARRTDRPGSASPPVDLRVDDAPEFGDDGSEVPRLWTPRLDGLVRLLDAWGVGATYELTVAREGEIRVVALVVERGPRDWGSALRARDAGVGLAVREATYEVRHALRLPADGPAVVVARVDEGSPAAQARLQPNEVLREMDGRPLFSPEDFESRLAQARAAGRPSVRVAAVRLGRSRFLDLALSSATGGGG